MRLTERRREGENMGKGAEVVGPAQRKDKEVRPEMTTVTSPQSALSSTCCLQGG